MRRRKRGAQVQRFQPIKVGGDLNTGERAVLACGCCIFVGRRSGDHHQVATATQACSEEHQPMVELAGAVLMRITMTPRPRPMVTACVEALNEAWSETRGR
jgi:hypothetical protein